MPTHLSRNTEARGPQRATRPPALWWIAHAVAGVVLGGLPLAWGLVTLAYGETTLPLLRYRIALHGTAATLFALAMLSACAGLFAYAFLTCFDRIKHRADTGAKFAAAAALLLFIAALTYHAIG
jgi:hypothetical protein